MTYTTIKARKSFNRLLLVATATVVSACAMQPMTFVTGSVIDNVTVVNTRDGSLSPGMAIVIDNGRIVKIAASGSIRAAGAAQLIDASGKYAVPGFLDMHYHALEAADRQPAYWPLMVANGITGYREMSGSTELLARGQRFRKEIAQGAIVAPEMLIQPGRLISLFPDGEGPGIASAEQATREVQRQKRLGADYIKIIAVNRETFFATMEEAKKQGLHVAGHLSPVVSATEASNAGMRSMEHFGAGLISAALDCSSNEAVLRKEILARSAKPKPAPSAPPNPAAIQRALVNPLLLQLSEAEFARRVLDSYSEERCRALARTLVRNGTWQVPTLIRLRTMQIGADPASRTRPELRYVHPATRAMWHEVSDQFAKTVPPATAELYRRFYDLQMRMVKLYKEEGVKMLAGPDGGQWTAPGFALHREFDELARAGLAPLEILQMTTLNGAEFLGREAMMGTLDEGKNADLVLLDANPVASAANLHGIWGVVLKGRYLSRVAMEKLKEDVAAAYQ